MSDHQTALAGRAVTQCAREIRRLEKRIVELEAENAALRAELAVLYFVETVPAGRREE